MQQARGHIVPHTCTTLHTRPLPAHTTFAGGDNAGLQQVSAPDCPVEAPEAVCDVVNLQAGEVRGAHAWITLHTVMSTARQLKLGWDVA